MSPEPRFVVTSLTGFAKTSGKRQATNWYVIDRAWCHRIVRKYHRGLFKRTRDGHPGGEAAAQRYADQLNQELT